MKSVPAIRGLAGGETRRTDEFSGHTNTDGTEVHVLLVSSSLERDTNQSREIKNTANNVVLSAGAQRLKQVLDGANADTNEVKMKTQGSCVVSGPVAVSSRGR